MPRSTRVVPPSRASPSETRGGTPPPDATRSPGPSRSGAPALSGRGARGPCAERPTRSSLEHPEPWARACAPRDCSGRAGPPMRREGARGAPWSYGFFTAQRASARPETTRGAERQRSARCVRAHRFVAARGRPRRRSFLGRGARGRRGAVIVEALGRFGPDALVRPFVRLESPCPPDARACDDRAAPAEESGAEGTPGLCA